MANDSNNFWGRYRDEEPTTRYDPLQSFNHHERTIGFRVNFTPGRSSRPREQHIKIPKSYLDHEITQTEMDKSPLYRVLKGREPCVPIAADDIILAEPDADEINKDFSGYGGIAIMNKFSPLGIFSKQASGVAMVNYPTTYIRSLSNAQLNYNLLIPMRTSLYHLLEEETFRDDLKAPVCFFNIGAASGSSLKYLHSQSYAMPATGGLQTFAFEKAFMENEECITCRIANKPEVVDHLGQKINYKALTVWEDSNVRVIVPFAPFRTSGTRIIPKEHVSYIGKASDKVLESFANALTVSDFLMNASVPPKRTPLVDRTIPFRQVSTLEKDFHMFIDIYPPFPMLAAESADFLGLTPYKPERIATRMRSVPLQKYPNLL